MCLVLLNRFAIQIKYFYSFISCAFVNQQNTYKHEDNSKVSKPLPYYLTFFRLLFLIASRSRLCLRSFLFTPTSVWLII